MAASCALAVLQGLGRGAGLRLVASAKGAIPGSESFCPPWQAFGASLHWQHVPKCKGRAARARTAKDAQGAWNGALPLAPSVELRTTRIGWWADWTTHKSLDPWGWTLKGRASKPASSKTAGSADILLSFSSSRANKGEA
jgi:hypothetical protein